MYDCTEIFSSLLKYFLDTIDGNTACPREVLVRGGHPLGLIEYVIERVYQVFLPFELHKFGICINPKECPPLTLHQPKDLNGCPPLTFINLKIFRGVPSSHFHQPKGFRGVPSSHFSST